MAGFFFPHVDCGIIWIPEKYQTNLSAEEIIWVISCDGFNHVSLADCVYGEDWSKCWSSHSAHQQSE